MRKDGKDEEDDERSRTIVAMPAWMAEEIQKEREKLAQDTTRTLAFDPSEAIRTAAEAKAAANKGRANSAADAVTTQGDMGTSRTLMFDPKAAQAARDEAQATEPPADQTASYSAEELKRLRDSLRDTRSEDDGNARTVAYMPAVTDVPKPAAPPKEEGDAFAATVAYMPAVNNDGTVAYSPGQKEKLLQSLGRKPDSTEVGDEGSASTQVYSKDQAKALQDAYSLLESSRKPQGAAPPAAAKPAAAAPPAGPAPAARPAPSASGATVSSTTSPGSFSTTPSPVSSSAPPAVAGSSAPACRPAASSVRPSSQVSTMPQEGQKSGMSTGALIALLLVLLALAGGATAVILHLLGIVDLPLPLPQLDLFSK
jgi:hypothetical protein